MQFIATCECCAHKIIVRNSLALRHSPRRFLELFNANNSGHKIDMSTKETAPGAITRRASKTDGASLAAQLNRTFTYYNNQVTLIIDQASNAETLAKWTECEILERRERLRGFQMHLDDIHKEAMCELDEQTQNDFNGLDGHFAQNEKIIATVAKLTERAMLIAAKPSTSAIAAIEKNNKIQVEVQQVDSSGNIQNVWGTFDGDFSKWRTFHDKWVASMHTNEKVKKVTKLQNLQAACIGDAKIALGEWEVIDDNYEKAFERLVSI